MAKHQLRSGSIRTVNGQVRDLTRIVEIEAELVAVRTAPIDTEQVRGVTEQLYYTPDGRLFVHVESWSTCPEEGSLYSLLEIAGPDLQKGGRFELLGHGAWAWLRSGRRRG